MVVAGGSGASFLDTYTVFLFTVYNIGVRLNLKGHEMINEIINRIHFLDPSLFFALFLIFDLFGR